LLFSFTTSQQAGQPVKSDRYSDFMPAFAAVPT
jgi:hypothetical protein